MNDLKTVKTVYVFRGSDDLQFVILILNNP